MGLLMHTGTHDLPKSQTETLKETLIYQSSQRCGLGEQWCPAVGMEEARAPTGILEIVS